MVQTPGIVREWHAYKSADHHQTPKSISQNDRVLKCFSHYYQPPPHSIWPRPAAETHPGPRGASLRPAAASLQLGGRASDASVRRRRSIGHTLVFITVIPFLLAPMITHSMDMEIKITLIERLRMQ